MVLPTAASVLDGDVEAGALVLVDGVVAVEVVGVVLGLVLVVVDVLDGEVLADPVDDELVEPDPPEEVEVPVVGVVDVERAWVAAPNSVVPLAFLPVSRSEIGLPVASSMPVSTMHSAANTPTTATAIRLSGEPPRRWGRGGVPVPDSRAVAVGLPGCRVVVAAVTVPAAAGQR